MAEMKPGSIFSWEKESLMGGWADEEERSININYVSCSQTDDAYIIVFSVNAKNLKDNKATIIVEESELFFDELIGKPKVDINYNGSTNINLTMPKIFMKKLSNTWFERGEFEFVATIICDGVTAKTPEFKLNCIKKEEEKKEERKCFCNRDFSVEEIKEIVETIRENTFYSEESEELVNGKKVKILKEYPVSHAHTKLFYLNSETRDDYEKEVVPEKDRTYEKFTQVLNDAFKKYEVNTCIRKIHFFAQMYWETQYFTQTIEASKDKLSYDPYRGRGFIHLTKKETYLSYDKDSKYHLIIDSKDVDITTNYSKVAIDLNVGIDTSAWFWSIYKKADFINPEVKKKYNEIAGKSLNEISDYADKYIDIISKLLSGGSAMEKRRSFYLAFKNVFNYESCTNKIQ